MNVRYFTDADGQEMATLPRAELEAIVDAADHARALADFRAGRVPGLTVEEARAYAGAKTPLAFWRHYRGLTQEALSRATGIAQGYISDLENGRRAGPVETWLLIGKALDLPLEELVEAA
jgi:DNA-binding XRE family transcriptional regulator